MARVSPPPPVGGPEQAADRIVAAIVAVGVPAPRILIDGRAGAGKTTVAALVSERIGATTVHLDDIYPGWEGLAAASAHVGEHVLDPEHPRWRRWDWAAGEPAEWHEIPRAAPIVVEGCGALSRSSAARADLRVYVHAPAGARFSRAIARDGEVFRVNWERWARQEEEFDAQQRPAELADLLVDGISWRVAVRGKITQ